MKAPRDQMRRRLLPLGRGSLLALCLASCSEETPSLREAAPQIAQEAEPVAQLDGLLFGDWQSKAELQILLEGLEPGQFFSVIEGEYHNGLHRYRAVVQPFTELRYEMWATYWGLDEQQFYETELMLLRKGFQRQHLQIYQDEAKQPYYQMVYVRPVGSPLRGNAVIEDSLASNPEPVMENPADDSSEPPPVSDAPVSPRDFVADSPGDDPAPPTPESEEKTSVSAIYTVVAGDTLSGISRRYKITVNAIKAENKLRSDMLRVGQKLKIPSAK